MNKDSQGPPSSSSTNPLPAQPNVLAASLPPELMQGVLNYVSRCDLTKCALVSKHWNENTTPLIWKVLERRCFLSLLDRGNDGKRALARNQDHVRELDFYHRRALPLLFRRKKPNRQRPALLLRSYYNLLDLDYPVLTNLSKLRISCPVISCGIRSPSAKDGIVALIQNNVHLRALEIASPQNSWTLQDLICLQEGLQELWISVAISSSVAKMVLDQLPLTIRKLRLNVESDLDPWTDSDDDTDLNQSTVQQDAVANSLVDKVSAPPQDVTGDQDLTSASTTATHCTYRKLASLRIDGYFGPHAQYILLPFLATCGTDFQDFRCPDTDCFKYTKLGAALTKAGVSLRKICFWHLPQGQNSTDAEIAAVISQHTQLQVVRFRSCKATGLLTAQAIVNCGQRLREFDIEDCDRLSSEHLTSILSAASNLRGFSIISTNFPQRATASFIKAQDLISVRWNTPMLEYFGCPIRVPRPDNHVPAEEVDRAFDHPSIKHCHDVERAVYRQISLQTNLTELSLCCMEWTDLEESLQWYSPEMSLASGLSELASLKNLEKLCVRFMNHRIRVPELKWMAENWPRLESLEGLFLNGKVIDQDVVTWLEINKPKWAPVSVM